MNRNWILSGLLGLVVCSGCGQQEFETAYVSGSVLVNGSPVTAGSIIFTPSSNGDGSMVGKSATGYIEPDGSFVLSTYGNGDGAVVGSHRVTVRGVEGKPEEGEREGSGAKPVGTTNAIFEVKPGDNLFEVQLDPPVEKPKKRRRRKDDDEDDD